MTTDPLDALRQPIIPLAPRADFSAGLRRRLEEELDMTTTTATTDTTVTTDTADRSSRPAASGSTELLVYLAVDGAADALAFYERAFGAVETTRIVGGDGRIGHAEMLIDGVLVMLSDEFPEMGVVSPTTAGGSSVTLYLRVPDVDATFEKATEAGATAERPPADQFHGNRNAVVVDPFGHRWMLTTPVEHLTDQEMADRAAGEGWQAVSPEGAGATQVSGAAPDDVIELGYWTFSVPDVERAARFYGAVLGWRFDAADVNDQRSYRHVANTAVPMGINDDMGMKSPALYYRVEDLEGALARVREHGGEVIEVSDHPSGGNARCRDDQGIEFELWKPAPGY